MLGLHENPKPTPSPSPGLDRSSATDPTGGKKLFMFKRGPKSTLMRPVFVYKTPPKARRPSSIPIDSSVPKFFMLASPQRLYARYWTTASARAPAKKAPPRTGVDAPLTMTTGVLFLGGQPLGYLVMSQAGGAGGAGGLGQVPFWPVQTIGAGAGGAGGGQPLGYLVMSHAGGSSGQSLQTTGGFGAHSSQGGSGAGGQSSHTGGEGGGGGQYSHSGRGGGHLAHSGDIGAALD